MNGFSVALASLKEQAIALMALLPNIVIAVVVFVCFWLFARLVFKVVFTMTEKFKQSQSVRILLARMSKWIVMLIGMLVSATIMVPSLNAASIFSALGIGSVAIGFAFKDIFQNWIAGVLLLVTRPFKIGDSIISNGNEGKVIDIQVRATIIENSDKQIIVVPNSELFTGRVTVITANDYRRVVVPIVIGFDDDVEQAKAIMQEALNTIHIDKAPESDVIIRDFMNREVTLHARFWVPQNNQKPVPTLISEFLGIVHQGFQEQTINADVQTISIQDNESVTAG